MALIGEMKYLTIGGNTYSIPEPDLPIASSSTLGGIKVGSGLTIDSSTGVLTATGTSITIDTAMSDSSTNTVQNKVIKSYVDTNIPTKVSDLQNDSGFTTNTGTVTSVGAQNATNGGLTISGSPVTSSGTITIGHSNVLTSAQTTQALYPIKIDKNGHISSYGTAVTSLPASDVYSWAKEATKPSYTALEVGAVATSAVGAASGVAPLNASGKIDETYLPSYVDDVIEGYYYNNKFYKESTHTTQITGEAGKIYIDLSTEKTYRYGGSAFVEISSGTSVTISRNLTSGTKSATINVDGTDYDIYSVTNTDEKVKLTSTTTNAAYKISLAPSSITNNSTYQEYYSTNLTYNPSTKALVTGGTVDGYTLAAASAKAVDSSISAGSSSANLPTSAAVASFVEGKGYITSYTETDPVFSASAAANISSSDITNWNGKTSNTGTVTKVTAGTGLKVGTASSGGDITTTGTINHINSVTAQTTQALYPIKIDAQGHISAYGTAVTSLPASDVSDWAKASTKPSYTASEIGLGNVSNNADLNSTTGAKGDIIYWSAANTPAHLTNTSSTTKKFLSITSQVPSWVTLSNSDVGLGNVENTKLSTWTGSTAITTLGTISTGTIPLANVSGADDIKAIEALTGTSGLLKKTAANTWALDTTAYLTSSSTLDATKLSGTIPSGCYTNTTYTFDGTYNASTNKAATVSTVTNAIGGLDVSNISGFGAGKTLSALSETDGKISATFQDISITTSQISNMPTVPTIQIVRW